MLSNWGYPLFGVPQSLWWDVGPSGHNRWICTHNIQVCTPLLISVHWKRRILERAYKLSISSSWILSAHWWFRALFLLMSDCDSPYIGPSRWVVNHCYNHRASFSQPCSFCFCPRWWSFQGPGMQPATTNFPDIGHPPTAHGWFSWLYHILPMLTYYGKPGEQFLQSRDIDSNPSIRPEYRVFGTSKPNPKIKILKSEYRIRIFFFFAEYRIIQGPLLKNPNIPNIGLLFCFTIFFCFFSRWLSASIEKKKEWQNGAIFTLLRKSQPILIEKCYVQYFLENNQISE